MISAFMYENYAWKLSYVSLIKRSVFLKDLTDDQLKRSTFSYQNKSHFCRLETFKYFCRGKTIISSGENWMLNPFTNFDVHILINLTPYVKEQLIPNNVFVPFKFEIVFPKHLRNSQLIHIKHFTVNSPHKYFNNTLLNY